MTAYHRGLALCLLSATGFGFAAVFAKEAFSAGVTVPTLLSVRFTLAAVVLWAVVAVRRPRFPSRRVLLVWLGLGAVGYAMQSAFYFGALTQIDASLVGLLLYAYPALVLVLAYALRRERPERRKLVALAASSGGLVLLLGAGAGGSSMAPLGVVLALAAAVTYAVYITVAAAVPPDADLYLMTAVICTAAAVSIGTVGALTAGLTGGLRAPSASIGWLWVALLAMVSTAAAIILFLVGMRSIGAPAAALASCLEPVVTAASAFVVYGERLSAGQLLGAAAVLAAVIPLRGGSAPVLAEQTQVPPP